MSNNGYMSHMDSALLNKTPQQREAENIAAMKKRQEFNEMVHSALSSSSGADLLAHFEQELRKPVYIAGQDTNVMLLQEGARQYILRLIDAYKSGGES